MAVKIAINGFGRIGRLVLRGIVENRRKDIIPVAINDLGSPQANAHLLRHDSVHGPFPGDVRVQGDKLLISTKDQQWSPITVSAHRNPADVPFKDVDVAMECTGLFRSKEKVQPLIQAGSKKVLISAPAPDVDATIVYGVNQRVLKGDMNVVSNASCTTNCLAPLAYVMDEVFGIRSGYMLTIHSYTGDQRTVDTLHKDLRRARAAGLNMIPTSTGAARAVGLVLPQLVGRLDGSAVRIPTANVSMVSFDFIAQNPPKDASEINEAILNVVQSGKMGPALACSDEPLVSSDFNHNQASCVFDATQTTVLKDGALIRVCAWYDNEWGFANRMADTAVAMGSV